MGSKFQGFRYLGFLGFGISAVYFFSVLGFQGFGI